MAVFYNRATLSYNDTVTDSNLVTGEYLEVLSASKSSLSTSYEQNDRITYIVTIVNSGQTPFTGLSVTDNLGSYTFHALTLVPLTYVDGSVRLYVNGILQTAPAVNPGPPLVFSGITVPAGGNAVLLYEARVNAYAPPEAESVITNTAVVSGGGVSSPIEITSDISAANEAQLTISKSICPDTVVENGQITYTFVIQNTGNQEVVTTDNAAITDLFNPILDPIEVTFNGTSWTAPANYTYDSATGLFQTVPGQISVPAASYVQDETTGQWTTTPGASVLKVTGTL